MSHNLNIGVLAHVDAGKTSLTERILFETGAIAVAGSVDAGTTQTDTNPLEKQRGITIRAAVASFLLDDRQFNLIDTPGHPDFIAEVERSLGVLDAVILVVSAVEGVQPQTRRLARAIRTIGLPCVIFVNKVDRAGAREATLLDDLSRKLDWSVVPISTVTDIGSRDASISPRAVAADETSLALLAENDDDLLQQWIEHDGVVDASDAHAALLRAMMAGMIVPVTFGSAMTGAGMDVLLRLLTEIAPESPAVEDALSAEVFKVERDRQGNRVLLARIWHGELQARADVAILSETATDEAPTAKVTRLERSIPGGYQIAQCAGAGDIVRIHGLPDARVGDAIGSLPPHRHERFFLPVFETVVREKSAEQRHALHMALTDLADQDPFISLRHDPRGGTMSVRLFGEVQKEVIESNLLTDYGIPVEFEESRVICIERPLGSGESTERITATDNPFAAGVGLRVTAAEAGSGVNYWRSQQSIGRLPLSMYVGIEETVLSTLHEGLHGWEVLDVDIELTFVEYYDPVTIVGDFRSLTPLVLMAALREAGTDVCEPIQRFRLDLPEDCLSDAVRHLIQHRAIVEESAVIGDVATITGEMPAATVPDFERMLPGISRGESDLDHWHSTWRRVPGEVPSRERTDLNPLVRAEYLTRLSGRM